MTTHTTPAPAPRHALIRAWPTLAVAAGGAFVINLDQGGVPVANPRISDALGASLADLQWIYNAYLLPVAVLLVSGGALADRFGRRRILVFGLALFVAGSAGSALSQSTQQLIAVRLVEGVGAALIVPATIAALRPAFSGRALSMALGWWVAGAIGGAALGPIIAGALMVSWSWRSVFWSNIALGLVCLAVALARVRSAEAARAAEPLRGGWNLAVAVGLAALVWGLIRAGSHGWTSIDALGPIAGGLLVLVVIIRASGWLVEGRLGEGADIRRLLVGLGSIVLLLLGAVGAYFLLAFYLQRGLGVSPLEAGVALLPQTAVAALLTPLAGRMIAAAGVGPMLAFAFAAELAALLVLSRLDESSTYLFLVSPMVLIAFALSIIPTASLLLAVGTAPPDRAGFLSGVQASSVYVGNVLSVAVTGSVVASTVAARFDRALAARGLQPVEAADGTMLAQGVAPEVAGLKPLEQAALEQATLDAFASAVGSALLIGAGGPRLGFLSR